MARQFNLIPPVCEQAEYHLFQREKVEVQLPELYHKIGRALRAGGPSCSPGLVKRTPLFRDMTCQGRRVQVCPTHIVSGEFSPCHVLCGISLSVGHCPQCTKSYCNKRGNNCFMEKADSSHPHESGILDTPGAVMAMPDRRLCWSSHSPLFFSTGVGAMTWSPLACGIISGKYRNGVPDSSRASLKVLPPAGFRDPKSQGGFCC